MWPSLGRGTFGPLIAGAARSRCTGAIKQGPLRQGSPQGVHDASVGWVSDPVVELERVLVKVKELGLAQLAAEQELVLGRADHVLICSWTLGKDQVPRWC